MGYVSAWFIIMHWSSGKFIHPYGGWANPGDGTPLNTYDSSTGNIQYRFVQVEGHWGYIQHTSGKIWHPRGDRFVPGTDTRIELYKSKNGACLFAIDQENHRIVHRSGLFIHPYGGWANPGDYTDITLYPKADDSARWKFVLQSDIGKEVQIYDKPHLLGEWKIINAIINPKAEHTFEMSYKVGSSNTTKNTMEFRWEVTASVTVSYFSASTTFSSMVSKTESSTWTKESSMKRTIHVKPGKSVVTWQWVYGLEQWGDKYKFKSNILQDTESKSIKPDPWKK